MRIDIREEKEEITQIQFSDSPPNDGLGKCCVLEKNVPVQFSIRSLGGESLHIKQKDVDSLIEALKLAKRIWS